MSEWYSPETRAELMKLADLPHPDWREEANLVFEQLNIAKEYEHLFRDAVERGLTIIEPYFFPYPQTQWSGDLFWSIKKDFFDDKTKLLNDLRTNLVLALAPFAWALPRNPTPSRFNVSIEDLVKARRPEYRGGINYFTDDLYEGFKKHGGHASLVLSNMRYALGKDPSFLKTLIPVSFPQEQRFSHMHIVGSTGSGKSTLLQNFIADDLETDAAVVVIDPHKQLVPLLASLDVGRNVVLVDPTDPPGINIFDVKQSDDPVEREKVFASVVKMFTYLFREGETPPTGKQMMVFQYLCRLVLSRVETHGSATLLDLFEFLVDPAKFADDIARLPMLARSFFADFSPKNAEYKNTAAELRYRLHTILANPTLEKMFSASKTEIDIGRVLDDGSLLLIDADQDFLGDMHATFGKIFLAQIMEAARKRDPAKQNRPAFVYIDEAHRFLDEQVNDLLTDARKYRVGCILAHQHLGQIPSSLIRGALQGTAIKLAGGVRAEDATSLAADMRTTREQLMSLRKYSFAAYINHVTPAAIPLSPEKSPLERFALAPPRPKRERQAPPPSPMVHEQDSDQW